MEKAVKDLFAGLIVFLVALPLCLGIAIASNAPAMSGIVAGVIGGIVVGILSGSHTSVSGPAAGLTAIVATQIKELGSFETFLLAVIVGGMLQILLGISKAGNLSAFFPSSVIQGLLAAIGITLILKQLPYLFGHDPTREVDLSVHHWGSDTTFSELWKVVVGEIQIGAAVIGVLSLLILLIWDRFKILKKSLIPAPLLVVIIGVGMNLWFQKLGNLWSIEKSQLVEVPVSATIHGFFSQIVFPDWSEVFNPEIYIAGFTIAIVASLETLLNLDAVDKLDRHQRHSPPNRELWAQGIGNVFSGLFGGLPMTSVVIRGSVNVNAGNETKNAAIFHGILLAGFVVFLPRILNLIPLSCLAAILLMTGFKLASPTIFRKMASGGRYQFLPFILTLGAIVLTDLLIGIIIGLILSLIFILNSNLRRPIRQIYEKRLSGDLLRIELGNQVSFLNRASLEQTLRKAPRDSHVLIDARQTDYIDPDILALIREFKEVTAPVYNVHVSLVGFRKHYKFNEDSTYVDFSTRESPERLSIEDVVRILHEGNQRFANHRPIDRSLLMRPQNGAYDSSSFVAFLSGVDSRIPAELVFDLSLGDAITIRVPAHTIGPRALGGLEFACVLRKAKLIVVLGHTHSQFVQSTIQWLASSKSAGELIGCDHLESVFEELAQSIPEEMTKRPQDFVATANDVNQIARAHIARTTREVIRQSDALATLLDAGKIGIVGALYDMSAGTVEFFPETALGIRPELFTELSHIDAMNISHSME